MFGKVLRTFTMSFARRMLLRGELPDHDYIPFNKVTGQPFLVTEVEAEIKRVLDESAGA